jgi:ParB family chromosome partitioning protein
MKLSAEKKKARPALGMGLDALLTDSLEGDYFLCPVEKITPSPSQPRKIFPPESLEELAQSLREKGLIQPIVVRKLESGDYELIAGERRWRAAQKAGLMELPAILRNAGAEEVLELALVENVQRENLNPVDEARAYKLLMDTTGMTQESVAGRIGKSRVSVANSLRLLSLSPDCLDELRNGSITPGHARALLSAPHQHRMDLLRTIIARGLSVREAEALASKPIKPKAAEKVRRDPDIMAVEKRLSRALGAMTALKQGRKKGSGSITVHYRTLEELDRIIEIVEGGSK